ncbi:OadG family protein [bacterium]|nr:OadG family protein [bacterium]
MNETLAQGIAVMCIGMGTVLTFLCILIFSMHVMSKIISRLNEIFPEVVPQVTSSSVNSTNSTEDEEVALAIASAMFKG